VGFDLLSFHLVSTPLQNPSEWSAQLLLGLEAINASKDERQAEEERTRLLFTGSKYLERAFNANQRNASAANALCEIFIQKGNSKRVKLLSLIDD